MSDVVTVGGVPSLTQTSVVRYRPALITVGGSPVRMMAGLPASSYPVTTLFMGFLRDRILPHVCPLRTVFPG